MCTERVFTIYVVCVRNDSLDDLSCSYTPWLNFSIYDPVDDLYWADPAADLSLAYPLIDLSLSMTPWMTFPKRYPLIDLTLSMTPGWPFLSDDRWIYAGAH